MYDVKNNARVSRDGLVLFFTKSRGSSGVEQWIVVVFF